MKDFFSKFILFLSLIQIYKLSDICKFADHNFYLLPINKTYGGGSITEIKGLNKYDYYLILESNPFDEDNEYQYIFNVSFPVNVNIDLNLDMLYKFYSSRKFCINDVVEGKQENIVGKLYEYNSEIKIFERIWMKNEEVFFKENIEGYGEKNYYYMGKNNNKHLLLKKVNRGKSYNQLVRIDITPLSSDSQKYLEQIEIGNIFSVITDENIMREGNSFSAIKHDDSNTNFTFTNIENLICYYYESKTVRGKCFDSSEENEKTSYL